MVKFWSQIYKQWKPTNKIMFWIGMISIIVTLVSGLIFGGQYIITIYKNNIKNSSLTNSPIIQGSPGTTVTYIVEDTSSNTNMDRAYYNTDLKIYLGKSNFTIYNTKIILPSGQEAFIKKMTTINHPEEYVIASSNSEDTDFFIPAEHKVPDSLSDRDICFYFVITHENIEGHWYKGKKLDIDKESCYYIKDVYKECHNFTSESYKGSVCVPEIILFTLELDEYYP